MKRKSFEHEKEVRAFKMLREEGTGMFLKCDLDALINRIHISPFAPIFLRETVEKLCLSNFKKLDKKIVESSLFEQPDY